MGKPSFTFEGLGFLDICTLCRCLCVHGQQRSKIKNGHYAMKGQFLRVQTFDFT
jgi:hypothetical protein